MPVQDQQFTNPSGPHQGKEIAERIARYYGRGVETESNNKWMTCCPVHGETPGKSKPSLEIFASARRNSDFFWPKHYGISFKCWSPSCPMNTSGPGKSELYRILVDAGLIQKIQRDEVTVKSQSRSFTYAVGPKRVENILPIPQERLSEWEGVVNNHVSLITSPAREENNKVIPAGEFHGWQQDGQAAAYPYFDISGHMLGLVIRIDFKKDNGQRAKAIKQLAWATIKPKEESAEQDKKLREGWAFCDLGLTPPYGLEYIRLAIRESAPALEKDQPHGVLVVEGEKTTDAANEALLEYWRQKYGRQVKTPWPITISGRGGANGLHTKTNWDVLSHLKPKTIWLWPDNDEGGYTSFLEHHSNALIHKLTKLSATWGGIVKIIDIRRHANAEFFRNKWDLADYDDDLSKKLGLSLAEFIFDRITHSVREAIYSRSILHEVCAYADMIRLLSSEPDFSGDLPIMEDIAKTPCGKLMQDPCPSVMFHPCKTLCHLPTVGFNSPAQVMNASNIERNAIFADYHGAFIDMARGPTVLPKETAEIVFGQDIDELHAKGAFGNTKRPPTLAQYFKTRTLFRAQNIVSRPGSPPLIREKDVLSVNVLKISKRSQVILNKVINTKLYEAMDRTIHEMLAKDEKTAKDLRQHCAAIVQHCFGKSQLNRWLYLTGKQGTGKDLILATIKRLMPDDYTSDVDIQTLMGDFFSPGSYAFLHIQDAASLPQKVYENLKKYANSTPVSMNVKGKPHVKIVPCVTFAFTSNQLNLAIDSGDRRLTIVEGPTFNEDNNLLTEKNKEFAPYHGLLAASNNIVFTAPFSSESQTIKRTYLQYWNDVDLSDYNFFVGPQNDPVKSDMADDQRSPLEKIMLNMIYNQQWPLATGITWVKVIIQAIKADQEYMRAMRGEIPIIGTVKTALKRLGFKRIEGHKDGHCVGQRFEENTGILFRITDTTLNILGIDRKSNDYFRNMLTQVTLVENRINSTPHSKTDVWKIIGADTVKGECCERWCPASPFDTNGRAVPLPDALNVGRRPPQEKLI